jgi:hypothetical protein
VANKVSIIEKLTPFLKEGVEVRFKEFKGWQVLLLSKENDVLSLTATGDQSGYFNVRDEMPDWATKAVSPADELPVVPALEGRSYFMRNGAMTGPITTKGTSNSKLPYFVDSHDGNWTRKWDASGRHHTMHVSPEISEYDLVEMVQSRVFTEGSSHG